MLRRKLFIYAIMYITGMTGAFIIFENGRYCEGIVFLISVPLSISLVNIPFGDPESFQHVKRISLAIMLIGSVVFFAAYFGSETAVSGISKNKEIRINCRIISVSRVEGHYEALVRNEGVTENNIPRGMLIKCNFYSDFPKTYHGREWDLAGRKAEIYGKTRLPDGKRNPGCFNYRLYLKSKRIYLVMSAKRITIEKTISDSGGFDEFLYRYRRILFRERQKYEECFSDDKGIYGFMKGVVFGDASSIDEEVYEEFTENNTAHILAVSGLHVGFLFLLLKKLLKSNRKITGSAIIILIILMYGEITMWSASTQRAVTIITISILARHIRRPFDMLSALSAAAFIILSLNPYQIANAGFHMTFIAISSISFLSRAIEDIVGRKASGAAAVQAGMMPYISFSFNKINLLSFLINIPIIFSASILIPLAIAVLAIGIFTGIYPEFLLYVVKSIGELVIRLNRIMNFNGEYSIDVSSMGCGKMVFTYLAAFFTGSEYSRILLLRGYKREFAKILILLLLPSAAFGMAMRNEFLNDEIVFVDVGQGDAIHVRANNRNIMFDGGGNVRHNIGKKVLKPYLLKNGVNKIDAVFLTHLHADHCKGSIELGQIYPIGTYAIHKACESGVEDIFDDKSDIRYMNAGKTVPIDKDVAVDIVWPLEYSQNEKISSDNANEFSMVMIIKYKGKRIMITGDLPGEEELAMTEHYKGTDVLKCDILKVSHHGSKTSSRDEFIDAVSPKIAVIQVGERNIYGHPSDEVLKRFAMHGIKLYRTDRDGAIGIDIRNGNIFVDKVIKENEIWNRFISKFI